MPKTKRYNEKGMRMTDCCGACSTFMEDGTGAYLLCCKKCYESVGVGEGDGAEFVSREAEALAYGKVA
jgi:hypothetical protein